MSQADAISIGSKVRVTRVRDRIPQAMVDLLKKDANGTVKGIVIDSAVRRTISINVPRPSWLAAISRNTSSSAPARL